MTIESQKHKGKRIKGSAQKQQKATQATQITLPRFRFVFAYPDGI